MDSKAVLTDEQLVAQYKQGNTAVLELFVYRYHPAIYAYLYRLTSKRQLAEDLAQECFVRVFTAFQTGRLPERFRPWIYRIATNLCRDVWKSGAYRYEVTAQDTGVYDAADGGLDTVASFLEKQDEREAVIAALSALPEEERQIVVLRFYQDLKLDEIAELLELPSGTVKSKLYRAFKRLADTLQKGEEQDEPHLRKRQRQ